MTGPEYTKQNEGCKLEAYQDTRGNWTIGWGHKCRIKPIATITQAMADDLFASDYAAALDDTTDLLGRFDITSDAMGLARAAVVVDMVFELGALGVRKFVHMLAMLKTGKWSEAAVAIMFSEYARQVPERAKRNAEVMKSGVLL